MNRTMVVMVERTAVDGKLEKTPRELRAVRVFQAAITSQIPRGCSLPDFVPLIADV